MPVRALAANLGIFGPDEGREITAAFEAVLKDMGLTDRNDPATLMVAKLTIELATQGEFTAASLHARIPKEMKTEGRPN